MTEATETEVLTVDQERNAFMSRWADGGLMPVGKSVPYIGWYWRTVDFSTRVTIADCKEFVGHCENNKWGYNERDLTDDERAECCRRVDEMIAAEKTLSLADKSKLEDLLRSYWAWMDELHVPVMPWNQ